MSEEKPRLSRRELRERGLLRPVEGDSSADELRQQLTYTQEIRLGRISRRDLRARQEAEEQNAPAEDSRESAASAATGASADAAAPVSAPSAESPREAAPSAPEVDEAPAADNAPATADAPTVGTAPSAPSAATAARGEAAPAERKSVFERFDSAPLLDDGTRPVPTAKPTPVFTAQPPADDAPEESSASLQERLLAKVRQDTAEANRPPVPQENVPAVDSATVADALPAVAASADRAATAEPPQRTPIREKIEAPEPPLYYEDEDDEEIEEEKPRSFLMIIIGILAGLAIGILVGVLVRNYILSDAVVGGYDFGTVQASVSTAFHSTIV